MNLWIRSLVFNGAFYGWTILCSLIFLPVLLLPRIFLVKVAKIWSQGVLWSCEHILGLHLKIIGAERLPTTPAIFAAKHQSAWETLVFHSLLADPSIVLKQELLWIPLFGWYLQKLGVVPLSRSKKKGVRDLKKLLKKAEQVVSQGRPILIFPEGTRSKPGYRKPYQSGVASLYLHLKVPVIPIAHNAGLFWPRRGFIKYPGCIILEVLEPLYPGFSKQEFMQRLENAIETKTNELVRQQCYAMTLS